MDKTNPIFSKFDAVLGKTTPTVAGAPVSSRADEIRALGAPSDAPKPGLFSRIKTDVQNRGANVNADIAGESPESKGEGSIVRGFQAASEGAGAVLDVGGEVLKSIYNTITPQSVKDRISTAGKDTADLGKIIQDSPEFAKMGQHINDWADKHPVAAKNLISGLKIASSSGEISGAILGAKGVADVGNKVPILGSEVSKVPADTAALVEKTKNAITSGIDKVRGSPKFIQSTLDNHLATAREELVDIPPEEMKKLGGNGKMFEQNKKDIAMQLESKGLTKQANELNNLDISKIDNIDDYEKAIRNTVSAPPSKEILSLQDTISPKLTPKEIKLALKEGRLSEGQDPGLLRSGTPDSVIPSDDVIHASKVIEEQIPGASKMKPSELYSSLDDKISEISEKLKPQMQATPIKPETIDRISSDWEDVKAKQLADPYISNNVNIDKIQNNFEKFLTKSKSGNMDDLWETAKAYDSSVPGSIKTANSLSSEVLQDQKSVWLQNRAILRDAIKDSVHGMGGTSAKAFDTMHNMFDAQGNLLSTAAVREGMPSKVVQWAKDNPWKAGAIGYGVAHVTGLDKPIKAVLGL